MTSIEESPSLVRCSKCQQCSLEEDLANISEQEMYCEECLEVQLNIEQKDIKNIEQRFIFYKQFESSLDENQVIVQNKAKVNVKEQDQQEIQRLTQQLKALDNNLAVTKQGCENLRANIIIMENQEEKYWEQINRFDKRAIKLQEKALSAKFDKQTSKNQIQKIGKTSIIHSFANIQIDDNLGYVWGLPMGKKADNADIIWEDVNSGLGHVCMALNFLAIKYGYEYINIEKIKIKGGLTEILLKGKKEFFPLGYTGRDQEKVFGEMMETLLLQTLKISELIQQLENVQYSEEMRLPFKIDLKNCKIGEYFIDPAKLEDRSKWSHWTKAMRYFLINFKHILTIYSLGDQYL